MNSPAVPRVRTALLFAIVSTLTACGGGGGAGGGALPTPVSPTPMPLVVISQNGSSIELTGTVNALIPGGFSIQGGASVGYLHVYTNSSTVVVGLAPFKGENVDVVGTGTLSSGDITASKVTQLVAQSSTTPPTATPSPAPSATPTPVATPAPIGTATPGATIALPPGVFSVAGTVAAVLSPGKLEIQAGSCGYMYVYLNSSTAYFDGTPAAGNYAVFTGTGTHCASLTAASVSLSSVPFSSTISSGTVTTATPYGFTLQSAGANVPVALASSTIVYGATLTVGSSVTVTALGTQSTGLTATQVAVAPPPTPTPDPSVSPSPTPGPIAMQHVMTFAYIYGYGGTPTTVPLSSMTPYVTWSMTDESHAAMLRAAGIKTQIYVNFWRNYSSDNPSVGYTDLKPGGAHAAAEALNCSGTPVYDSNYGGGYEADPRSSAAFGHAQTVVNYVTGEYGSNYDAIFSDDTGAVNGVTLPCNYSESTYDQAVNTVHGALGVPMWINALGAAPNPANAVDLAQPSNVIGAMCESCYADDPSGGDTIQTGTAWQNVENAEIGMVAQHRVFWDYARAAGPAASETALRTYAYASFLLSYDPSYAMISEALSTASGFRVMPETLLVPLGPLATESSVAGYQAPGGAYFREFSACYYGGAFVSRCAVAVNPSASTEPVPSTSYAHSMVLTGAGVLDGGTASFSGQAPSQLAPGSAVVLFP